MYTYTLIIPKMKNKLYRFILPWKSHSDKVTHCMENPYIADS